MSASRLLTRALLFDSHQCEGMRSSCRTNVASIGVRTGLLSPARLAVLQRQTAAHGRCKRVRGPAGGRRPSARRRPPAARR